MKISKTKNSIGFFTIAIALLLMGCKEETKVEKVVPAPAPEKEVIVVPPPPPPPAPLPPPPPAEKPTSISLDKNGIKVKTEKVDVKVEK